MSNSPARILAVAAGLMVAGALFGAIAGVVGAAIAVSVTMGLSGAPYVLGMAAILGAVIGAPLLPATSFLLLRRVPLGMSFVGTTVGTTLGGIAGWIAAWSVEANPILWPTAAAMIGFFLSVVFLRMRFSSSREAVRVPGA